jgi:hypothetical protein
MPMEPAESTRRCSTRAHRMVQCPRFLAERDFGGRFRGDGEVRGIPRSARDLRLRDEAFTDEYDCESNRNRNLAAVHLQSQKARQLIREGAAQALGRFNAQRGDFPLLLLRPPFRREVWYRPDGATPAYRAFAEHPTDLVRALNMPMTCATGFPVSTTIWKRGEHSSSQSVPRFSVDSPPKPEQFSCASTTPSGSAIRLSSRSRCA